MPHGRHAFMSQSLRYPEILRLARRDGLVTVDALSDTLGVSQQTIRRDLADLAESGQLERVHGGAVLPSGTANIAYAERRALNNAAKSAIAEACLAAIPDGASLCLNIGTTTEAVARALAVRQGLLVVTNNLNVAQILGQQGEARVVVTGGDLRATDGGLTGPLAARTIARFRVDFALIGCSALDPEGDLLDFDMAEVEVSRAMMSAARRTVLVADHSKFQRVAPARIAHLSDIDHVITDAPLPPDLARRARDWPTRIEIAPAET